MMKFALISIVFSIVLFYVAATHASDKPAVQAKMADSIELVDQGCRHAAVRACIVATLPKSIRVQDGSFTPDPIDSRGSRSESEALRFGFQSLRMIGGDPKSRAEARTNEPKKDLASLSSKHCVVEPYTIGDIPAQDAMRGAPTRSAITRAHAGRAQWTGCGVRGASATVLGRF